VKRILLAAALGLVLAVLAAPASAGGSPVITAAKSGRTFTITRGVHATLRLSHQRRWTRPVVTGNAIRLTQVNYFRDPGFDEWMVSAIHDGRSTITSGAGPRRFRVTIVVRG
jgi:hypothetical protein